MTGDSIYVYWELVPSLRRASPHLNVEDVMKRALIDASVEVAVVAIADKVGTRAPFQVAPLQRLSRLMVEKGAPAAGIAGARIRAAGVEVEEVGADEWVAVAHGFPARLSTRLSFLVAGIAMASWAPQVPYAKARLGLGDSGFGLLLLCLGVGSVLAMQATGAAVARFGSRAASASSAGPGFA